MALKVCMSMPHLPNYISNSSAPGIWTNFQWLVSILILNQFCLHPLSTRRWNCYSFTRFLMVLSAINPLSFLTKILFLLLSKLSDRHWVHQSCQKREGKESPDSSESDSPPPRSAGKPGNIAREQHQQSWSRKERSQKTKHKQMLLQSKEDWIRAKEDHAPHLLDWWTWL